MLHISFISIKPGGKTPYNASILSILSTARHNWGGKKYKRDLFLLLFADHPIIMVNNS